MEVSGQRNSPSALLPRKNSSTHWTAGWVGVRAVLDGFMEKNLLHLPGFEPRNRLCGGLVNYRHSCSLYLILLWRQGRSVSIVTCLRSRRLREFWFDPARGQEVRLSKIFRPALQSTKPGDTLPAANRPAYEDDPSSLSSAEIKNAWTWRLVTLTARKRRAHLRSWRNILRSDGTKADGRGVVH
jgi:hypothetical protein